MSALLEQVVDGARHARRWAYRAGLLRSHRVDVPVISVGGQGLGGRGKTPITGYLAWKLCCQGNQVAVLMSGSVVVLFLVISSRHWGSRAPLLDLWQAGCTGTWPPARWSCSRRPA